MRVVRVGLIRVYKALLRLAGGTLCPLLILCQKGSLSLFRASLVAQMVKRLPAMRETWV